MFDDAGAVVAYRNNVDNDREMWAAVDAGASGTWDDWTEASTGEGWIAYCPMEGPRIATFGSALAMVWSAAGSEGAGSLRILTSGDGGTSWGGESSVPDMGDGSSQATLAVGAKLWVADSPDDGARLTSTADGSAWSPPESLDPGSGPLGLASLAAANGMVVVVGATEAGAVWARRLE